MNHTDHTDQPVPTTPWPNSDPAAWALPATGSAGPDGDQPGPSTRRMTPITGALTASVILLLTATGTLGVLYSGQKSAHNTASRQLEARQKALTTDENKLSALTAQLQGQTTQLGQVTKDRDDLAGKNATLNTCVNAAKTTDLADATALLSSSSANVTSLVNTLTAQMKVCG